MVWRPFKKFTSFHSFFTAKLHCVLDEKWKTVRSALTPIFTGGKIRQLNSVVQSIGEDYADTLLKQCNDSGGRVNGIRFKE